MVEYETLKPPFIHKHTDSATIHEKFPLWEINNQLKVSIAGEETPTQIIKKKQTKKKVGKVIPNKGIR